MNPQLGPFPEERRWHETAAVTRRRLVGSKECSKSVATLPLFTLRRDGTPRFRPRFPFVCTPRGGFAPKRAQSLPAPMGKAGATVPKGAEGAQSAPLAAWRAGFSGGILPLEEGRDSTSASRGQRKRRAQVYEPCRTKPEVAPGTRPRSQREPCPAQSLSAGGERILCGALMLVHGPGSVLRAPPAKVTAPWSVQERKGRLKGGQGLISMAPRARGCQLSPSVSSPARLALALQRDAPLLVPFPKGRGSRKRLFLLTQVL